MRKVGARDSFVLKKVCRDRQAVDRDRNSRRVLGKLDSMSTRLSEDSSLNRQRQEHGERNRSGQRK